MEQMQTRNTINHLNETTGEITEISYVQEEVEAQQQIIYPEEEEEVTTQDASTVTILKPKQFQELLTVRPSGMKKSTAQRTTRQEEERILKMFFLTMYGIAKQLPPKKVLKLRRQVFNLVSEYEENLM